MSSFASVQQALDPPGLQRDIRLAHLQGRTLSHGEINRFRALGIDVMNLATPWPILADRVVFDGPVFYFADEIELVGESAFTLAVISDIGFVDIVAWHPASGRQALWKGHGFALGERQINNPDPAKKGLAVYRSPMDWLRAGRSGIVIFRNDHTCQLLAHLPVLFAEDTEHQLELQKIFPPDQGGPEILLRENAADRKGMAA